MKALFAKKFVCPSCQGYFKRKIERKTVRYICSNYDARNGRCDVRIPIEEEFIKGLICRRFRKELSDQEIKDIVECILIKNELEFEIKFTTGEDSILFTMNHIRF